MSAHERFVLIDAVVMNILLLFGSMCVLGWVIAVIVRDIKQGFCEHEEPTWWKAVLAVVVLLCLIALASSGLWSCCCVVLAE